MHECSNESLMILFIYKNIFFMGATVKDVVKVTCLEVSLIVFTGH